MIQLIYFESRHRLKDLVLIYRLAPSLWVFANAETARGLESSGLPEHALNRQNCPLRGQPRTKNGAFFHVSLWGKFLMSSQEACCVKIHNIKTPRRHIRRTAWQAQKRCVSAETFFGRPKTLYQQHPALPNLPKTKSSSSGLWSHFEIIALVRLLVNVLDDGTIYFTSSIPDA